MRRVAAVLMGAALVSLGPASAVGAHGPGHRPQDRCYDRNADTHWECERWERELREQQERQREQEERQREREARQREAELERQERQREREARWRQQ
ncbi:MAG: hypothetical protein ACRDY7_14850 [Acidimicrobiia bacterium]